jgi:hypothetical protein
VYGAGGALALYAQYDAALSLIPLVGALCIVGVPRLRETLLFGSIPFLALLAWVPQLDRSLDAVDRTKAGARYLDVSPTEVRDQVLPLFLGERASAASAPLRTMLFLLLAAVLTACAASVWRRTATPQHARSWRARPAFWLLVATGAGTLVLHALAVLVDVGIFSQRYLTFLIPVGCALLAAGVAAVPWRFAVPSAAGILLVAGAGLFLERHGREREPDPELLRAAVKASGARTVLTNSAVVVYYLRDRQPILNRGLGFGADLEPRCGGCARPLLVVDDEDVGPGARPGPGSRFQLGHFVVRLRD